MSFSYSRVGCWWTCPFQYKLRYIDGLEVLPDMRPNNALYLGTAIHEGIEHRSIDSAIESYRSNYTDLDIHNEIEEYKLKKALEKCMKEIPEGEYEYKLEDPDGFIGYIDNLVLNEDGTYTIYDFKHSNNVASYRKSGQVHLYKYYYERLTGNTVRDMYYVMIPKVKDVLNESLDTDSLKRKIDKFYEENSVTFEKIEYDRTQINHFFARKTLMDKDTLFEKHYNMNCKWCDYALFCRTGGKDLSELTEESKQKFLENSEKSTLQE